MKKNTVELTDTQVKLIWWALSDKLEIERQYFEDGGVDRDAQDRADKKGLEILEALFDSMRK
jgi:hypothetical protein